MTGETNQWVKFDAKDYTYVTGDGTRVPAELADNVTCLADVLRIACIRAKQREARQGKGEEQ